MGTERFSRAASSDRGKQNGIASNSESLDSFAPTQLCLDHSHRPVLAPATLAALASTLRFPIACVLCRPRPRGSVDALAPARLICYPHRLDRPSRSFPRLGSPKLIRSFPFAHPSGLPVHVVRSHGLDYRMISRIESRSDVLAGDGVQFLNCLMRQLKASASNILSQVFH
jgi:hypothetical protein